MLHQNDVPESPPVPPPVTPAPFCAVVPNVEVAEIGSNVVDNDEDVFTSVCGSCQYENPPSPPGLLVVAATSLSMPPAPRMCLTGYWVCDFSITVIIAVPSSMFFAASASDFTSPLPVPVGF